MRTYILERGVLRMKKKKIFGIVVLVIIALGVIGSCGKSDNSSSQQTAQNGTKQEQQKAPSKEQEFYNKFLSIQMGSDFDTVNATLGGNGQLQHENEIGGIKTQSYQWKEGLSNVTAMFQNGQLTNKATANLSFFKGNTDFTMDQFNKIQQGMPYDDVKAVMGTDGYLESESQLMGSNSTVYGWISKSGANVQVTFSDGQVNSKTQFGLK